jgi:hypothetical protein
MMDLFEKNGHGWGIMTLFQWFWFGVKKKSINALY